MKGSLKYILLLPLFLLIVPPHWTTKKEDMADQSASQDFVPGTPYHMTLLLQGYNSPSVRQCGGFEYNLARRLERLSGIRLGISLERDTAQMVDSLRNMEGAILVLPLRSVPSDGTVIHTSALPDSTVWAVHPDSVALLRRLEAFLTYYSASEGIRKDLGRFAPLYGPYQRLEKETTYTELSPYDSLFKVHARTIGWDWRMLCALAWKESGFRLELSSRKGASGIMQIMPKVALLYGVKDLDDLLDPEKNIALSARILQDIEKDYTDSAPSKEDLTELVLACYNAGTGRIKELRDFCMENSLPCSTWKEMKRAIPLMNESIMKEETETKLGPFKGVEAEIFVKEMLSLYEAFKTLSEPQS